MLPPPRDVAAAPRVLVAELAELIGEQQAAAVCASLLSGADPHGFESELVFLGGRPAVGVLEGAWKPYWARVWGARGLLYVWSESAAGAVVAGVSDPHWRVAEMCLKVSALRDLPEAAAPAERLAHHELPRVRAQVARALGVLGDTEHVDTVLQACDDPDPAVRRSAAVAADRMARRLDLDPVRCPGPG